MSSTQRKKCRLEPNIQMKRAMRQILERQERLGNGQDASKMAKRCKVALRSLDKYPLHLDSPYQALILEGFNKDLVNLLEQALDLDKSEAPVQVDVDIRTIELSPIPKASCSSSNQEEADNDQDYQLAVKLSQEWSAPDQPDIGLELPVLSQKEMQEKSDLELALRLNQENYAPAVSGQNEELKPLKQLGRKPSKVFELSDEDDDDVKGFGFQAPGANARDLPIPTPSVASSGLIDLLSSSEDEGQEVRENRNPRPSGEIRKQSSSDRIPLEEVVLTPRPETPVATKVVEKPKPKLSARELFGNVSSVKSSFLGGDLFP